MVASRFTGLLWVLLSPAFFLSYGLFINPSYAIQTVCDSSTGFRFYLIPWGY